MLEYGVRYPRLRIQIPEHEPSHQIQVWHRTNEWASRRDSTIHGEGEAQSLIGGTLSVRFHADCDYISRTNLSGKPPELPALNH
jgi:hypothetical protein